MGIDPKFGPEGELIVPSARLGRLGEADPAKLRLVKISDDLLVCGQAQPGMRSRPLLYGDLRLFHVAELMALVSSMRKDGTLSLLVPHARKVVFFAEGEVVYASSNVEDDRLGEVLWRKGFLSLDQLSEVHDLVTPKRRLGRVLTDLGMLTPRQLYDGIREQVLEIVFSTFHFDIGEFVFVEGKPGLRGTVQLDKNTQTVIREGVKRVQVMTRLEGLFPDREAVPVLRPVAVDVQLGDHEEHLLGLIDGKRTVDQLIEASHLGEFETLKALARLLTAGKVDARALTARQRHEGGKLPDVLESYAKLLRLIHQTLKVGAPNTEKRLEEFTSNPSTDHQDLFRNVGLDPDGQLDVDTLYRNARRLDAAKARERAFAALRAIYDYAVFQAMDVLDDDDCDALLERLEKDRAELTD